MNKDLITMIQQQDIKVISVDKERGTFTCSDGNDYPLEDANLTMDELQLHLDKAKKIMKQILSEDGETA